MSKAEVCVGFSIHVAVLNRTVSSGLNDHSGCPCLDKSVVRGFLLKNNTRKTTGFVS